MTGEPPVNPPFSACPQCGNRTLEKRELVGGIAVRGSSGGKTVDYCASCGYVDPEYDRMVDKAREARRLR